MPQEIKIKTEAKYASHNVKANKSIDITFKAPYAQLHEYIKVVQMLNENVTVACKIGADKKPLKLGTFMVQNLNIDNDGEGKLKFNSLLDYTEPQNINELAARNDEPLFLLLKATIELEDEENDVENDENE